MVDTQDKINESQATSFKFNHSDYAGYIKLATAYVPPQLLNEMFPLSEALMKGTLFPELYRPYS